VAPITFAMLIDI